VTLIHDARTHEHKKEKQISPLCRISFVRKEARRPDFAADVCLGFLSPPVLRYPISNMDFNISHSFVTHYLLIMSSLTLC